MKSGQADVARLLFLLFVHVADANNEITADDVQSLNEAMRDRTWTQTGAMRVALGQLRAEYAALWAGYASKKMAFGTGPIADLLGIVCEGRSPDEVLALRESLGLFVARICGSPQPVPMGGYGAPAGEARLLARGEVERLLQSAVARPVAVGAPPPPGPVPIIDAPPPVKVATTNGEEGVWAGGPIRVRCVAVIHMTPDVKTYTFKPIEPLQFAYKPGQFVIIEVPIDGKPVRRSYTISSSPTRPHTLSITVKRVPQGRVSNWLYETTEIGAEYLITGLHGHFSCSDHPSDKLLLISGGSGVTPMMSMVRFLADTCAPVDIAFVNNVRTPADIIFKDELLYLSAMLGERLRLHIVPGRPAPGQPWPGAMGSLTAGLLLALVPDALVREVFVCGPAGYMDLVKGLLQDADYPMERFHMESFGGDAKAPPVAAVKRRRERAARKPIVSEIRIERPESAAAEIFFKKSNRLIPCTTVDTILDIGECNGVSLQSSCRSGVCGACRVSIVDGDVIMDQQSALTPEDIAAGAALACVAQPRGRVVVDA